MVPDQIRDNWYQLASVSIMASAAGDPSTSVEDLCANMLEDCAKIKALLLKLKESLRRDKAATRLQAARISRLQIR